MVAETFTTLRHGYAHRRNKGPRAFIYRRWQHMIQRCHNPNDGDYPRYGAKGITVCARWRSGDGKRTGFECFLEDVGMPAKQTYSLDRIDVKGNYEPKNVRWATPTQQANNRTNNSWITVDGETKTQAEWSKLYGVTRGMIRHRLKQGWDAKAAVTTPLTRKLKTQKE